MALSFSKILGECGSLRFVKNNQNTPTIMIVLVLIVWQNPAKNTQPFGPRARSDRQKVAKQEKCSNHGIKPTRSPGIKHLEVNNNYFTHMKISKTHHNRVSA